MSSFLEILLIVLVFMCIGYATARQILWPIILALLLWFGAALLASFVKGSPFAPYFPTMENFIITLIEMLVFYGGSFIICFAIGKVVNNVEKYQRA